MTSRVFYLSHPEVVIDPDVPVPDWPLSETGQARAERLAGASALAGVRRIVSSTERKAQMTAEPIAAALGLPVVLREDAGENDRSATGFLPPPEFNAMADAFFARPTESVRGWERAMDAQARIVAVFEDERARTPEGGDLLLVGHGGVGTLLYCALAGQAISRAHDQLSGGGCVYDAPLVRGAPTGPWRRMETLAA